MLDAIFAVDKISLSLNRFISGSQSIVLYYRITYTIKDVDAILQIQLIIVLIAKSNIR